LQAEGIAQSLGYTPSLSSKSFPEKEHQNGTDWRPSSSPNCAAGRLQKRGSEGLRSGGRLMGAPVNEWHGPPPEISGAICANALQA